MLRTISLAVWLVAVAVGSATLSATLAADGTIVVLGDSNAAGFGVAATEAFPAQLERDLRQRGHTTKVINAGVPGDTFGGLAKRVDGSVPKSASLVIVQAGYNDRATGVPPDTTIANMRSVLEKLHGRHQKAVLCGFFDRKWDAIGRKLAATYQARFVPGSTCYDPSHRGPDGLHMSAAGHEVVARRLAQALSGGAAATRARHGKHAR